MMFLVMAIVLLAEGGRSLGFQKAYSPDFEPRGSVRVGDRCDRDRQCVYNAFCRAQQMCLCEPNYTPSLDGTKCHATSGAYCKNHMDCASMTNAECVQGACSCRPDYLVDTKNASNCIMKPKRPGDMCRRHGDCVDAMTRALCHNEVCQCMGDFRFINESGQCVETRGIYQPCRVNYECFDPQTPDALYCKNAACAYTEKYLLSKALSGSSRESSTTAGVLALLIVSLGSFNYF